MYTSNNIILSLSRNYSFPYQDISSTRADNIFSQAAMDREVFSLASKAMLLHREGKLKDQKKGEQIYQHVRK